MIFETHRLLIRPYVMDDFENFYQLNADEEVMRYIRPVQSREQTFQFFRENMAYYQSFPVYGRWALIEKLNKQFIGSFMLRPSTAVEGDIELGYALFKIFWTSGYATESVYGGLDYAFAQLKLPTVIAITQLENIASQKVLLKSGFTQKNNIEDKGRIVNLFRIINPSHG
jgi:[ribosomal protein S5]-alanine N-acetyltransferase